MPPPGPSAGSGPKESETAPTFDLAGHIDGVVGVGSIQSLAELAGSSSAAIVTDRHIVSAGLLDHVTRVMPDSVAVVIEPGEPTSSSVSDLSNRVAGYDTLVALGGGSVLDTAKLAAALVGSSSTIKRHLLSAEPFTDRLAVVAVPTTAGSGAEVTRTCVLTAEGHKTWAWDELLRPSSVVLDPNLTVGLPLSSTVASGLDAFVHAVEATTAQRRDPAATAAAMWAIETLRSSLPAVVLDPGDIEARAATLAAATAAGLAIDRCGTGIAHGLGHALGSLVPIPHGLAVSLCLWSAAEFNAASTDDRCVSVAGALGQRGYVAGVAVLLEETGLLDIVLPMARAHPLEADLLAMETLSGFNAPMCANNVRPVDAENVGVLAERVTQRWNLLGGHR